MKATEFEAEDLVKVVREICHIQNEINDVWNGDIAKEFQKKYSYVCAQLESIIGKIESTLDESD